MADMKDISSRIKHMEKSVEQRKVEHLGSLFDKQMDSFLSKFESKYENIGTGISKVIDEVESEYGKGAYIVSGLRGSKRIRNKLQDSNILLEIIEHRKSNEDLPKEIAPEYIKQQLNALQYSIKILGKTTYVSA
jgi:hypothetical protein